ncbi:MAG: thioredoxin-disulfide reductase [Thaumarchaeota archaeon]|nr:thioredoxin-disulfide reductase [Nitrososphaerota archaeon]|tara:strand:+ start:2713 stop:3693 length:981 start_codon:yes stop_codon:yes gene_type:complete
MMATDIKSDIPKQEKKRKYDVVILGSGPAGLTAAIYTARAKLQTLVISGNLPGGQLMTTSDVENFPGFPTSILGPELMMNIRQQAERFEAVVLDDIATQVDFKHEPFRILTTSTEFETDAVIVATGASPRKLGLKSEETFGGKGVSYCATCDGPFFKDKDLIVVGGGDSALEEAIFLTKFAKNVKLVHRRDKLRASRILQERAFDNPKIDFLWNSVITDISGDKKVHVVITQDVESNETRKFDVGGIFIAIGHDPNTQIFKGQLDMDDINYLKVRNHTYTSVEGVFAAGDVHDHRYRQAVTAAGFGCMAAIDVVKYLEEKHYKSTN